MPTISMTGFGEAKAGLESLALNVEIKSVNHRFADIVFKLPNAYARFEPELAKLIQGKVRRGRIEIFVGRKRTGSGATSVVFDEALFDEYLGKVGAALDRAAVKKTALPQAVVQVLARREVLDLTAAEEDTAQEYPLLEQTLLEAVGKLLAMREREGRELEKELLRLLALAEKATGEIKDKSGSTAQELKARLELRLQKLLPDAGVEPHRLAQEVAYLADRADITEELARLDSHYSLFKQTLASAEGGRKLEFVLQEIGREINTIGSKAQESSISHLVVDIKALCEKLREQVQNVE